MTLKAVYRQLAKRLHPDHARDAADAAARTELMAAVNHLRDAGNVEALQQMLDVFTRPAKPRRLRAADVDARTLDRAVLTEDGWVCPAK